MQKRAKNKMLPNIGITNLKQRLVVVDKHATVQSNDEVLPLDEQKFAGRRKISRILLNIIQRKRHRTLYRESQATTYRSIYKELPVVSNIISVYVHQIYFRKCKIQ